MILNPLRLGLFNVALGALGLKQACFVLVLPDHAAQLGLAAIVCCLAPYTRGPRWRAAALALAMLNLLLLATIVPGAVGRLMAVDFLLAGYLWLVMAAHARA